MAAKGISKTEIWEALGSWISFNAAYRIFGLALIILALSFYLGWSILYGTWIDPGLYSTTLVMSVFGILSILLGDAKKGLPPGS